MLYASAIPTPLGPAVAVVNDDNALVQLSLHRGTEAPDAAPLLVHGAQVIWDAARLAQVAAQLGEYFCGQRTEFDLPLAPRGTPFQRHVWDALRQVPYGTTLSYKQLAQCVGSPAACRAVGGASGKNPVWIVVPCHRIVGASGLLTGYAGGLAAKQHLLALEGAQGGLFAPVSPHADCGNNTPSHSAPAESIPHGKH